MATGQEIADVARAEAEATSADELAKVRLQYNKEAGALAREIDGLKADHSTALEKMRADNAEAIQTVQARASERVDGAQERVKVIEREVKKAAEEALVVLNDLTDKIDADKESARREIHAQGKTIARMKGEIRELKRKNGLWEKLGLLVANAPSDILVDEKDPIWEEIEKMGKLLDEGPQPLPSENPAVDDSQPVPGQPVSGEDEETD